jgi:hypothetical protein
MYFMDAIRYPFNSPGLWGKMGVAFILMLIPIFGPLVLAGYGLKTINSIMHGDETLPEFDLGGDFMHGIIILLVTLVYQIPVWIMTALAALLAGSSSAMAGIIVLVMVIMSIITSFLLGVALLRYAATGDTNVFLAIGDNFDYLSRNPGAVGMFLVNAFLFGLAISIVIGIGFVLLIIPGVILCIASIFSASYLYARFGIELGVADKAKNYV